MGDFERKELSKGNVFSVRPLKVEERDDGEEVGEEELGSEVEGRTVVQVGAREGIRSPVDGGKGGHAF